jgi:RES domain-containing protein
LIRVWRLCQTGHKTSAFSGEGARRYGGRWHHKGQAAVYTASTLSLAALEILVHVDTDLIPNDFVAFAVDIPEDKLEVAKISSSDLPANWRKEYPPFSCQMLGSQWLLQSKTAVIAVPSAVIPEESNFILNPNHPDFAKLQIQPAVAFYFDIRLWSN